MDLEARHVRRQQIVDHVGQVAMHAQLRTFGARADHHVILVRVGQKFGNIFGLVLAVAVHQDDESSLGGAHAALHRRAIADVVRMAHYVGAGAHGDRRAAVVGAIVDDDDFTVGQLERMNLAQ